MCGRFSFAISEKIIEEHFGFIPLNLVSRYNCAPSQLLAVITNLNPGIFSYLKWGFIPFWAKDSSVGNKMINAKAETISDKSSYKNSFATKRCLIPADSFYEWSQEKNKTPYRILLKDQAVFSMAGIWSVWESPENKIISSFAIITTEANSFMKNIHHRMPVILDTPEAEKSWLKNQNISEIKSLLKPLESDKLEAYPISKIVNSPKNDTAEIHNQDS